MVVFVDHEHVALPVQGHDFVGSRIGLDTIPDQNHTNSRINGFPDLIASAEQAHDSLEPSHASTPTPGSNVGGVPKAQDILLSMALSCYPSLALEGTHVDYDGFPPSYRVAEEIARSLDQTSLHALSMTCRQVRSALLPCRNQLVRHTLRCYNDRGEAPRQIKFMGKWVEIDGEARTIQCARDMVAECQRCSETVCRNCVTKPANIQSGRLYRLCPTCLAVPLSHYSTAHPLPCSRTGTDSSPQKPDPIIETCESAHSHWICRVCKLYFETEFSRYMHAFSDHRDDTAYRSDDPLHWGLGNGTKGIQCGRRENCLAAEDVEIEVENEDDSEVEDRVLRPSSYPGLLPPVLQNHSDGLVKRKIKKRVRVGANVLEGHERSVRDFLSHIYSGDARSWCGWCSKVVPSNSEAASLSSN